MKLSSDKRILVAGAGAIGSFYGGLMAQAGYNIELMARGKHLKAMQETGLLKFNSWNHGQIEIPVNAVENPTGKYDIIFLCVKSQDTATTCQLLLNSLSADGCIVSFQNGVENPDIVANIFGEERTIAASLFIGTAIEPVGTVFHSAQGALSFGAWSDQSKKFEIALKAIFDKSNISADISPDVHHTLWSKLVWNVAYNPLSALLESTCGPMIKSDTIRPLIENMVLEVVAAAKMHGVTITEKEWKEKIAHRDSLNKYKTSMLQDIERHRNPEVDGILGPVIRTHEANGLKAPYCETIYRSLEFKYGAHFLYCPRLTVDMIVRNGDELLLIERKNEPYGWALPGGFVDYGEKVEDAARRELLEETGINADCISMLGVYSDPSRDKRGHTVSVVYSTESDQKPTAGDDAKNAVFYKINALPDDIVFDHRIIINDYLLNS
ncbi:MAG: 2-dehydropantoate 2-reductase [Denitrovibrio sp.]|nr:MAG: 2-dehydropantoate 2-reductase [Denitrovibrio sp.]